MKEKKILVLLPGQRRSPALPVCFQQFGRGDRRGHRVLADHHRALSCRQGQNSDIPGVAASAYGRYRRVCCPGSYAG